ncbi:VOC family protein [Sedimenticola sp.]|uniref:VOC family protein n=1 Tax=Sedimenticola sp. TaxID=1940285 RepID=UPI003D136BF5
MKTNQLMPCVALPDLTLARTFYQTNFDAKVMFDCGCYLVLKVGDTEFAMMTPQEGDCAPYTGSGLTFNFRVPDVDAEYRRLTDQGLEPVMPLEDHPWGDRGFSVNDPNGVSLYLYTEKEPDDAFKPYFKT